jgi:DNA polymerase-4
MSAIVTRQAGEVAKRLRSNGLSGRTVTLKVRLYDFTTLSRSSTLPAPTDEPATIARLARTLLEDLDTSGGVRLLGVGVSGLADWIQEDLFASLAGPEDERPEEETPVEPEPDQAGAKGTGATWSPGVDVIHAEHGRGWVWGAGKGVVTVRFETAETPPGPVRSFRADDPDLSRWRPPAPEQPDAQ